jgi:hypothetical protein
VGGWWFLVLDFHFSYYFQPDDILRPSVERPDQVFVKESSDAQYVPVVFYVEKDKYGNEIKKPAHPYFPLEYLFVTLEAGAKVCMLVLFLIGLVALKKPCASHFPGGRLPGGRRSGSVSWPAVCH